MARYPKVPLFWYLIVLSLSIGFSILTFYQGGFELPWWGFFVFFFLALILTYPNGKDAKFEPKSCVMPILTFEKAY